MNNHEHMCMDGDNLAPENRLDHLECKCFPALSRLSHLSHRVSHLDFQRNTWSRDDLGRSWRLLRHQLLASLSRPYKEVSGPLQETPRAWKVWPDHRADQHTEHEASTGAHLEKIRQKLFWIFFSSDVFWKMHRRGLPCPPSLCQQNWGMCPKVRIFFSSLLS